MRMEESDFIAASALAVSLLSALISYRAHRHAVRTREVEAQLSFSREKSEFLVRVDRARKTFDRLEYGIKRLIGAIYQTSESERNTLVDGIRQLEADLNYLEGCQRQAWSLWDEAFDMSQSGLAHHKPRFIGLIEDDEQFADEAKKRCDLAEERINRVGDRLKGSLLSTEPSGVGGELG
jgi:hypothetical protein